MADAILTAEHIEKKFGGLVALKDLSFAVERGSITAVIGPNGAGKTTLINVMSGFLAPDSGAILFNGASVAGRTPHDIARLGISRTFQTAQIFNNMSVLENVMVGRHIKTSTGMLGAALRLPGMRTEERRIREQAGSFLAEAGLSQWIDAPAASLPIGNQRLLEIARSLAAEPSLIMLDEPAAGLNTQETRVLGKLIRRIRENGTTVVIVEHDMELVMEISDDIVVINFGEKIARGTPADIQSNPEVVAVYLGEEE